MEPLNILNIIYKKIQTVPVVIVTSDKVYENTKNTNKKFFENSLKWRLPL